MITLVWLLVWLAHSSPALAQGSTWFVALIVCAFVDLQTVVVNLTNPELRKAAADRFAKKNDRRDDGSS